MIITKECKMIIYIDIDETICLTSENRDYSLAEPMPENIEKANKLHSEGHTIIYWTARGSVSGVNWYDITKKQLDEWGAKYHDLKMGKPMYDLFIDDKALNTKDWK